MSNRSSVSPKDRLPSAGITHNDASRIGNDAGRKDLIEGVAKTAPDKTFKAFAELAAAKKQLCSNDTLAEELEGIAIAEEIQEIEDAEKEGVDVSGVNKQGKVIFEGNILSRDKVAHIVNERALEGRKSALFDLQDTIEDHLPCNQVRLRLRTNLVWGLSYRVVGAIRDVLFRMNEHARETGVVNGWNEFYAQLSEAESGANYAETMGYDAYGSGMNKAAALIGLLAEWRELAIKDAKALRSKLELPELYDLVSEAPTYDPSEANKMVLVTRLMLEGEPQAVIDEAVKMALDKCMEEHKQKVLNTVAMSPHMERLLTEVTGRVPKHVTFSDMPIDVQGRLIEGAVNSVKKLPQQMTKMRSVTTMDMVTAFPMIKRIEAKLNDVLADPRFDV